MPSISSHEGRFELFGPKRIPLLGYTLEGMKEDARQQRPSGRTEIITSGEFERTGRDDVAYSVIYTEETSGQHSFPKGITFSWSQLPTNEQGVYVAIVSGYQVPNKTLVLSTEESELPPSEVQTIEKSTEKHYYIVVATNRSPNPQNMELGVGNWPGVVIEIDPEQLDRGRDYSKVYHAMAHDTHHQDPVNMEVTEIGDIQADGIFRLTADDNIVNCFPSGMYIFGEPGQVKPAHPAAHPPFFINYATEEELDKLPRVGPALAKRIIQEGVYENKEDLIARVPGITESVYSDMASGKHISFVS